MADVNDILTDDAFNTFLGGQVRGATGLSPDAWYELSTPAREYAFNRVLESLRRRTPSIEYTDLSDPTELLDAVRYGAAEHIFQMAMTEAGDIFDTQRLIFAEKYRNEINGLSPTLVDGSSSSPRTFNVERR